MTQPTRAKVADSLAIETASFPSPPPAAPGQEWNAMAHSQGMTGNRLLQFLSADDYALLEGHLEAVTLDRGTVLVAPNQTIASAFFLSSGLSSIIAVSSDPHDEGVREGVEVGLTGREGMIGLPLVMDCDRTPHRIFMQIGGAGYRISAEALKGALDKSHSLQRILLRYAHVFQVQTTYTALSNAVHTIEERLARWLLMSHDRQDGDEIALTHDFMALMLGVRRPSVTIALHSLEGLAFIRSTRGLITIRNRADLEEFAGAAYGTPEAEYVRLIGAMR